MTAAGIALIAGGLATLVCFRAVLFGSGRRRARRQAAALEPSRRQAATPKASGRPAAVPEASGRPAAAPEASGRQAAAPSRRGSRRRALAAAFSGQPARADGRGAGPDRGHRSIRDEEYEQRGGLASIGLADEDDEDDEYDDEEIEAYAEDEADLCAEAQDDADEAPVRLADRPDRYGQRVDGWVRPEYRDCRDVPPSGEYWTPIPVDLAGDPEPSAKGYGWPVPVERLPAVPSYEPATGFDLAPIVAEPTEVVPSWPHPAEERPGRIRLPRSWGNRNETRSSSWAARDEKPADEPPAEERRRRPRPRPEKPADRTATVYVSRHAATEPPR